MAVRILLRTISSKLCHSLHGDDDAVSRPFRGSADYLFTSCHPRLRVFLPLLFLHLRSLTGTCFADTPMVVPVRGYLDGIRRLMVGDLYIGRGSKQRGTRKECVVEPAQGRTVVSRRGYQTLLENSPQRPKSQQHHLDTVRCKTGVSLHSNTEMPRGRSYQPLQTNLPCRTRS